jgi:hypothetical protein
MGYVIPGNYMLVPGKLVGHDTIEWGNMWGRCFERADEYETRDRTVIKNI